MIRPSNNNLILLMLVAFSRLQCEVRALSIPLQSRLDVRVTRHWSDSHRSLPNKPLSMVNLSDLDHNKESTSPDVSDAQKNSAILNPVVDKSVAKRALEKLRDRQRLELEETERMMEVLDGTYYGVNNLESISDKSLSTAASLLSGADYGFISRSEGPPPMLKGGLSAISKNYGPPSNVFTLGTQQFMRNLRAILGEYSDEPPITLSARQIKLQSKLKQLKLNSTEIWEREEANGPIDAPLIIKIPYLAICYLLDVVFEGSYVPSRFFLLETVARMPYFSYISMLDLYETLGFWRRSADAKRIHFAEELNEFAHLMIMESLGGDQTWWVRFVAQHSAIVYYFVLCGLFAISPSLSYKFSELLEIHAVNTYTVFMDNNRELLKELPPSNEAVKYYSLGMSDPFYAEFQTSSIVGHEVSSTLSNNYLMA
jgi:ubiquinol oxidase